MWRNSARRDALFARFEALALDDLGRSSLQALATEWRQWVDRERPVLVVRSVERLMDVITLLSSAVVPTGQSKIMASSPVPVGGDWPEMGAIVSKPTPGRIFV